MSILEIGVICGFISTPHFSRSYREYFGVSPRDERVIQKAHVVTLMAAPGSLGQAEISTAGLALNRAQGEATFASVKI